MTTDDEISSLLFDTTTINDETMNETNNVAVNHGVTHKENNVSPELPRHQRQEKGKQWICVILVLALVSFLFSSHNACKLEGLDMGLHEYKGWNFAASSSTGNTIHPVDRSWCPEAQCFGSPFCHPCQRRFLIVITNGRSASTTLTWMLNLLPGLRMGGENNNAIQKIMTMTQGITASPFQLQPPPASKFSAWDHNPIPDGSLACVAQKTIEAIVPPVFVNSTYVDPNEAGDIVGFKTIRLLRDNDIKDVPEIAKFLIESFPCARFLVNYRSDFVHQAQSQVTSLATYKNEKKDLDIAVERISKEVDRLKKLAKLLGSRAMTLDSVKWTEDVGELNKAVMWLGFDKTCAFPKLMELNTGRSTTNKGELKSGDTGTKEENSDSLSSLKGKSKGPRGLTSGHRKAATHWFNKPVPKKKNKAAKTPRAYKHSETNVQLDPRCRYVGG